MTRALSATAVPSAPGRDSRESAYAVPFLQSLPEPARARFLSATEHRAYAAGTAIYRQGEPLPALFLLSAGSAKECHCNPRGQQAILALHGPGDLPGLPELVTGNQALATCWTMAPTGALVVPVPAVRDLLRQLPGLATVMLEIAGAALHRGREDATQHCAGDALIRTSRRILELVDRWGRPDDGAVQIDLQLSQAELAAWAGLSREAVVKALRVLRTRDLVDTRRCALVVNDVGGLRQLVADSVGASPAVDSGGSRAGGQPPRSTN